MTHATTAERAEEADLAPYSSAIRDEALPEASTDCPIPDFASVSRYHMYHKRTGHNHHVLTPVTLPGKESLIHCFGKALRRGRHTEDDPTMADELQEQTFYVHKPKVAFRYPPRTLRRGSTKHATPVCVTNNSLFWKRWTLQFSSHLGDEGVLDPRGVVAEEFDAGEEAGDARLKGYKVRRLRWMGESGKGHHKEVQRSRKEEKKLKSGKDKGSRTGSTTESESNVEKVVADQIIHLEWSSPLSRDARRYHFRYAGLDFYWKGTGTVKEARRFGYLCRYNHLKLVARVPVATGSDDGDESDGKHSEELRDVVLGKYTSSVAVRKSGVLELYDSAILRLIQDQVPKANRDDWRHLDEVERGPEAVKRTRLYEIIVATGVCMILGEFQKRETIRKIIMTLLVEGGGGGGDAAG